ncbi:hypothetical protein HMPREF1990_01870, partial [Porphyromonas gingivalis W4087]
RLSHGIFREISLSIDCFSVSVQNKYNLSLIRFYVFEKLKSRASKMKPAA